MVAKATLRRATKLLVKGFHPQKVILFGSQARGTADRHSDVDLLVVADFQGARYDVMVGMYRALRELEMACDIVVLTREEYETDRLIPGTIARPASLEGTVLYELPNEAARIN